MNKWRIFGQHSKIPECCINFFCNEWNLIYNTQEGKDYLNQRDKGVDYIPCPTCIKDKNYVRIHNCDISCWQFMISHGISYEHAYEIIVGNLLSGRIPLPTGYYIHIYTLKNKGRFVTQND